VTLQCGNAAPGLGPNRGGCDRTVAKHR